MPQIFSILGVALGIIGLLVVFISSKIDKRQREEIKKLRRRIKRKDSLIATLEQENEFLKHQNGYKNEWLQTLATREDITPDERLHQAVIDANVPDSIKESEMEKYENAKSDTFLVPPETSAEKYESEEPDNESDDE